MVLRDLRLLSFENRGINTVIINIKKFIDRIKSKRLAEKLFGDKQEITWLKHTDWEYTCMTLTRDGKMSWKDEDLYDHDTTCFIGTFTLSGTEKQFTVTAKGESTAYFDRYKDSQSSHRDNDATKKFESSRFTGAGFTVTYK